MDARSRRHSKTTLAMVGAALTLLACSQEGDATSGGGAADSTTGTGMGSTNTVGVGSSTSSSSSAATGSGGSISSSCTQPWFSDDLEWADVNEATTAGPWLPGEGDASISTHYAHSGTRSLRIAYDSDEASSYLVLAIPGGTDHMFARWWELRERAGDFPGAQDYDWGGEKFNRFRSNVIGVEPDGGLDYPLGWSGDPGFGLPGTQDGGEIGLFGNSVASNDDTHFAYSFAMPRGEWHSFELEIELGGKGEANGATRLFIDGAAVAERTNVTLRPNTDALLDQIWIGGWYSNQGIDPDPSPAVRYVDDVVVCPERIGP